MIIRIGLRSALDTCRAPRRGSSAREGPGERPKRGGRGRGRAGAAEARGKPIARAANRTARANARARADSPTEETHQKEAWAETCAHIYEKMDIVVRSR